jgi:SAM-dependent methyltransferase
MNQTAAIPERHVSTDRQRPMREPAVASIPLKRLAPANGASAEQARYSYSSTKIGFFARCRELYQLVRVSLRSQTEGAVGTVQSVRKTEALVFERTGVRLENLKVLEIGPGQQLRYLRCFALKNEVVGIDTDAIPQELGFDDLFRMIRRNPWMRTVKTVGRIALRRDARFLAALAKELRVEKFEPLPLLQMDAKKMGFPDGAFGFVFSCSVFEHIDEPRAAIEEVARVLRPGGVACISIHLYTSHSGQHDPVIFAAGAPVAPLWPHLRPAFAHTVRPSAHLNRLSLRQWQEVFSTVMPGVHFAYGRDNEDLTGALSQIRAGSELSEYTDEELLTVNVAAIWKKPDSLAA